jgi:hypothetical protein
VQEVVFKTKFNLHIVDLVKKLHHEMLSASIAIIATSILCVVADTYQQTYSTPGTYAITIPANYAVKANM